ncbi:MAG TPA: SDR family NAD(P)-dependent oxidoreductase [Pseudonocardia sp.]|uniref:SDR family NAD(P)-dependent oxidoreductase n=1 Tax=Pseudonocardia sp. TaxID=60912 RepID=UPI002B5BEFCA|nr:SDR family NAD(P)-dependent oxidoreductase [Pseudonocardia sp.]HTF55356.1 SDR family NAD(P)-dependent oxidoreductase [Pseudonocardia sp.]
MTRVWLITGASSGFGRAIAEAAVAAGDTVVGAARRTEALDDLVRAHPGQFEAVRLDVTSPEAPAVVDDVVDRHGRLDVLVNNAGRTQVGALEETTAEELRYLFDLHFFGPAALTKAVLPHMRRQGGGAVVQMSSVGGQITGPGFGAYCATKFALEGLTQTLRQEVDFGVRFLIVEPGAFRTGLFDPGAAYLSQELPEYADTVGPTRAYVTSGGGSQPGDPAKAAAAILTALDTELPPLRLALGGDAVDSIRAELDTRAAELTAWEQTSRATDFDKPAGQHL